MRAIMAAVLFMLGCAAASAQDSAQTVLWANRTAVATAMAKALFRSRGESAAADSVAAIFVNLDFGSAGMLLTLRNDAGCQGFGCGIHLFHLEGDSYREILGGAEAVRTTPANEIGLVNEKRGGFIDLRFGDRHLSWNGTTYADVASFATTSPSTGRYVELCLRQDTDNYAFEQARVDPAIGRKTICACIAARMGTLGLPQPDVDRYADYVALTLDEDYENDYPAEEALGDLKREMDDARAGCRAQQGWTPWYFAFGASDPQEPQQPLSFQAFLPACIADDWLVGNARIGTPDRAITLCGCLGRKLAASGASQPALDGVGSYYGGAIDEDELADIDADVLELSDTLSEQCVQELPERPGTSRP